MSEIIFVAGTFCGGWHFEAMAEQLRELGHAVFTPTLSGLDAQVSVSTPINLDTHIDDVLGLIAANNLTEVVLVGWSYGGMVITGVADRTEANIKSLVYLDAQVPRPGQREWDLIPEHENPTFISLAAGDGLNIHPEDWMLQHYPLMQPHPLATKLQPLHYDQDKFDGFRKVFIFAEKWFGDPSVTSPIAKSRDLALSTPGWTVHSWPFGHDLVRDAGPAVLDVVLAEAV